MGFHSTAIVVIQCKLNQQGLYTGLTKIWHLPQLSIGPYQQVHKVEEIDAAQDEEKDLETLKKNGKFHPPSTEAGLLDIQLESALKS